MSVAGPRIEITVSPKGEAKFEVHGVAGGTCRTVSADWEKLFGAVVETADTAEAYEDPHEIEIKSQQK